MTMNHNPTSRQMNERCCSLHAGNASCILSSNLPSLSEQDWVEYLNLVSKCNLQQQMWLTLEHQAIQLLSSCHKYQTQLMTRSIERNGSAKKAKRDKFNEYLKRSAHQAHNNESGCLLLIIPCIAALSSLPKSLTQAPKLRALTFRPACKLQHRLH
jgi:hypothetical protein